MDENTQQPIKYRISLLTGFALVAVAGLFDLLGLILDLVTADMGGYIISFAEILLFPIIFLVLKVPFWKGKKKSKKLIAMITAGLIGLIPIIKDILPEVLIGVALTIYYTRKEDVEASTNPAVAKRRDRNIVRLKRVRKKTRKN